MPVWDAFLTERDKRHLEAGWGKKQPFGLGKKPAVLVIDDTVALLGDKPRELLAAMRTDPARFGLEGWAAIDRTRELLSIARRAGAAVVFTVLWHLNPWGRRRQPAFRSSVLPGSDKVVADLEPRAGELVLKKTGASAFHCTPLVPHLASLGIDTVLVCGNSTSGCVRATVVDAACHGYYTAVVEECTFDRTEASHAINLFDMHEKYADVMALSEIERYLAGLRG